MTSTQVMALRDATATLVPARARTLTFAVRTSYGAVRLMAVATLTITTCTKVLGTATTTTGAARGQCGALRNLMNEILIFNNSFSMGACAPLFLFKIALYFKTNKTLLIGNK